MNSQTPLGAPPNNWPMLIKSFIEWSLDSAKKDGLSIFSPDSTNASSGDALASSPTVGEVTAMIEELTAAEEKVPGDSASIPKGEIGDAC